MLTLAAGPDRPSPAFWRVHQGRLKLTWEGLETLTLDSCMRPQAWSHAGFTYRRGLEGKILEISREPHPTLKMHRARQLSREEGDQALALWACRMGDPGWVERVRLDEERFRQIWEPISILPPDQYRALVLQATRGCAWNRCTFCNLYRDRPYQAVPRPDFARHIRQAVEYFGEALDWRRGIFLGDANAGALPMAVLTGLLEEVRQAFPTSLYDAQGHRRHPLEFERVSSFQDTFTGRLRTPSEWRELRELGLRQLHLGVESGSSEVLRLLGKPSRPERVRQMVENLKQGGLEVSVIIMLGAGGRPGAGDHLKETVNLLRSLPLTPVDRVYLSEILVHPGGEYEALDLEPLTRVECREQAQAIRESLVGPLVSLYDVRQFAYH